MFCEKCGAQMPDDAMFCPGCGAGAASAESAGEVDTVDAPETASVIKEAAPSAEEIAPLAEETPVSQAPAAPSKIDFDTVKAAIENFELKPESKKNFVVANIVLLALAAVLYIFHSLSNFSTMSTALNMFSALGVSFGGYKVLFWILELAFIAFVGYAGYTYYISENKTAPLWIASLGMSGFTAFVWIGSLIWNVQNALMSGSKFYVGMSYVFYTFTSGIIAINIILCIAAVVMASLCRKIDQIA